MIYMRALHRWIGLVLGVQLLLWMLSGLVMGLLPHHLVTGKHYRTAEARPTPLEQYSDELQNIENKLAAFSKEPILSISLKEFEHTPVYRVVRASGATLYDAQTAQTIEISEAVARRVAKADYPGAAKISSVSHLERPSLATRAHKDAVWRVNFDDAERTSLYISANDGRVLERRNTYWRVFDFFWMLHIMDYQNRSDFNNALVIIASLILLWMAISGLLLWWDSFQREDFAIITKWRARTHRYRMDILDSEGGVHKTLFVRPLQTLYESMAAEGLPLPSSCGGGGTCGLCRVRIDPNMKASLADQRRIPQSELDQGYRLACQHRVGSNAVITLPHGLLDAKDYEGQIVSSRFVTPYICEIRVRLKGNATLSCRAGSYIQIRVPPFRSSLEQLVVPDQVRSFWQSSKAPTTFGTERELFRTYSISSAPGELAGDIALNVRMAMPKPDVLGVPIGVGSAYLASLKAGSQLSFRGPLGDFRVHESSPELVFIGGGAGMGPLRAMIVDQLTNRKSTRTMSFWYGARTEADLYYTELFNGLEADHDNFRWHTALSGTVGETGSNQHCFIHDVVRERFLKNHPDLNRCSFHICGPPPMLEAVLQLLEEFKVSPEKIAFDDFGI